MSAEAVTEFRFDRESAVADLRGAEETLWPVNAYSDADELNQLLEAAQNAGLISCPRSCRLFIYPLSICEPDPLLVVSRPSGPALLGYELKLREDDGEDPVSFTLRLLKGIVVEGNGLLTEACADASALDRIAAYMNRPGPWSGGDVCELVARELQGSGRELIDNGEG